MKIKNYTKMSLFRIKRYMITIGISLLLAIFGLQSLSESNTTQPLQSQVVSEKTNEYTQVVRVIDGDTIEISRDGIKESVRFIGIDTPELTDKRALVQCLARQAKEKTNNLLSGKQVRLEADPSQGDRDTYNRLLRYVFLEDGTHVNKLLIEQGFAHEYTYNLPYLYQSEFQASERSAQEKGIGLWSKEACQ